MRIAIALFAIASIILFLGNQLLSSTQNSQPNQQSTSPLKFSENGLPIPRFVSLKLNRTNVRKGPGTIYEILWVFNRKNVPIEIIAEFGNWRQIRDSNGVEGWIFHSLLSSRRTAIIAPWNNTGTISLYNKKQDESKILAYIDPGVYAKVISCNGKWCRLKIKKVSGWVKQSKLWGIYPGEMIE